MQDICFKEYFMSDFISVVIDLIFPVEILITCSINLESTLFCNFEGI